MRCVLSVGRRRGRSQLLVADAGIVIVNTKSFAPSGVHKRGPEYCFHHSLNRAYGRVIRYDEKARGVAEDTFNLFLSENQGSVVAIAKRRKKRERAEETGKKQEEKTDWNVTTEGEGQTAG